MAWIHDWLSHFEHVSVVEDRGVIIDKAIAIIEHEVGGLVSLDSVVTDLKMAKAQMLFDHWVGQHYPKPAEPPAPKRRANRRKKPLIDLPM